MQKLETGTNAHEKSTCGQSEFLPMRSRGGEQN